MAFCIHCGTDLLVDEARFCPMCGTPQPDLSQLGAGGEGPAATEPPQPAAAPRVAAPPQPVTTARQPTMEPPASPGGTTAPAEEDEGFFAGAGSPVGAPAGRTAPAPRRPAPRSASGDAELWRLGRGDLLVAAGSLVVLLSLFLTWFSGTLRTPPGSQVGALGRNVRIALTVRTDAMGAGAWHWFIFLISAAIFVYIALRTLPGDGVTLPVPHWQLLAVATGTNLVLLVLSLLLPRDIGSWTPSYGAVIGLVGGMMAVAGAMLRRREPEVITAPGGGRAARAPKLASSSAKARRPRRAQVTRVASATDLAPTDVEVRPVTTADRRPRTAPTGGAAAGPAPVRTRMPDDATQTTERPVVPAPQQRPAPAAAARTTATGSGSGEPPDEVVCGVCSTVNSSNAKVCRTCGVMLAARRG